jgi:cytidylate kinase
MKPVIAIDGPAASGKGTLARRLAAALGLPHLDTGLLYRAVGRRVLLAGADPTDVPAATAAAEALVPGDLDRTDLRGPDADRAASAVATVPGVRAALVQFQRRFAEDRGAVLDGRDIGTVIFPDAQVKLFITASPKARAQRRWRELRARGEPTDMVEVETAMNARDLQDAARESAPLRPAADAIHIDTTALDADAAFELALQTVNTILADRAT